MHSGVVTFGNTESRHLELIDTITKILATGSMTRAAALKLRGRLQFASANIFGRVARAALSSVTTHAYSSSSSSFGSDTTFALSLYSKMLVEARPRTLLASDNQCWFLQTDASYEPDSQGATAGMGAVLFDPNGIPKAFFSVSLDQPILDKLNPDGRKKTLIFECEF